MKVTTVVLHEFVVLFHMLYLMVILKKKRERKRVCVCVCESIVFSLSLYATYLPSNNRQYKLYLQMSKMKN